MTENAEHEHSAIEVFHAAEVWVELTRRGTVKTADDGWVYAYTDPGMLPGGQLEGFDGDEGLDVEATRVTGERLRQLVGQDVGIIVDAGYASEARVQLPPAKAVFRINPD